MTKAEKAQRLVDEGRVDIIQTTKYATSAYTPGSLLKHLTILYSTGLFFCTCYWGILHSYTDDLCAHALALRMVMEKSDA